jgi:hypothetical protein
VCSVVHKAISEPEYAILTTLFLAGTKNNDSWHARKGDLQYAFPLAVPMVPSSAIIVAANGEHLSYGGFSLSEKIHLGNFEFITDYFSGLSLSPRICNSGTTFMCSARHGASYPWRDMTEDST